MPSYHRAVPCILACAGGSIGHLAPLVAVCRAIHARDPAVRIAVACVEKEQEPAFLRREGFDPVALPSPRSPLGFLRALRRSFALLRECSPGVVFGKGGAVSIPLCLAARWKGIPIVIHESDAVMGRSNRFLSHFADVVCLGNEQPFDSAHGRRANKQRVLVTGNPIRPAILRGSRAEGLRITGFSGARPILLVIGGSQGAQAINDAVAALLPELLRLCDVVHITGPGKLKPKTCNLKPPSGYWSTEFADDALPHLYALSTVALSRAGAGVLSELAAWRIPAIVVPLMGLAQNHQRANADFFARCHACRLLGQERLMERLVPELRQMIDHPALRAELSGNAFSLHAPDAAGHIAEIILKSIA